MSVISYLDCGCAILSDGGREWCPTCAAKIEGSYKEAQPLDDKDFREQIDKILKSECKAQIGCPYNFDCEKHPDCFAKELDQILALLPSIEEAKREERERIINALKMVSITLRNDWQGLQVDNKVLVPDPENKKAFWQALRGGE